MTTWPSPAIVNNVPEITHLSPAPRLPQHELLRFDKMMQVADVTAPNYDQQVMQYARMALEARRQMKNEVEP